MRPAFSPATLSTLLFHCLGARLWPKCRGEISWPLSSKHLNTGLLLLCCVTKQLKYGNKTFFQSRTLYTLRLCAEQVFFCFLAGLGVQPSVANKILDQAFEGFVSKLHPSLTTMIVSQNYLLNQNMQKQKGQNPFLSLWKIQFLVLNPESDFWVQDKTQDSILWK